MPRSQRHPHALFSLKPINPRACDVVDHPGNAYCCSTLPDGNHALDVGFNIRSQSCNTLATLGRNNTDIIVEGSSIGRVQCSFEIDLDSGVVMLYDRSNSQTTQVFGDHATPFEYGRRRRVVVQKGFNTIIGMGGVGCDLVQFELLWHQSPASTVEKVKSQDSLYCGAEENPRLARTVDEAPNVLPSQRITRTHTPGERKLRMRYKEVGPPLGSGNFGIVYKCIDVDSGKFMAVKILERPKKASTPYYALKREVETLSEISHPHIVDYIASQGWDEPRVEIFMGLKGGNLKSLIESESCPPVADAVFQQMLQALDCLASKGIVHRDVKPENILYILQADGGYQFQLGDFGLCNRAIDAATHVGSPLFMAPEMFQEGGQTHKVDVWSLFVTMLWILNAGDFRQMSDQFKAYTEVQRAVLFAASKVDMVSRIREMAILNPEKRASAAQMLVKCYSGKGLSTPRHQVPARTSSPPTVAATGGPTPATFSSTSRNTKPKSRDWWKNATPQYRIRKAHVLRLKPSRRLLEIPTKLEANG